MSEVSPEYRPEQLEVMTAMVTPFHRDGSLNLDGAQELADYLVENGSDGLVLAGTTGESPTLTMDEQVSLFVAVADAVDGRAALIGGTGSNSTLEAVELTHRATELEVLDGLLVVSPYYNRPSQNGIKRYYEAVAGATELPVILYNIPVRTGREVSFDTISELFEAEKIDAVKDATGGVDMARKLHDAYGYEIDVYSGEDAQNLDYLRVGAIGAISVMSHWAGNAMRHQFDAFLRGDVRTAEKIDALLRPSAQYESVHEWPEGVSWETPNPHPAKAMMSHILGQGAIGLCRSPMEIEDEELAYLLERAPQILDDLDQGLRDMGLVA